MIYLEPSSLGWRPMKVSWEHALPKVLTEDNSDLIEDMFEWLVDPCLTFVRKHCKVPATDTCCLHDVNKHPRDVVVVVVVVL